MAPVLPAEMNASERPSRWRVRPTTRLDFGFLADRLERLLAHPDDVRRFDRARGGCGRPRGGGPAPPRWRSTRPTSWIRNPSGSSASASTTPATSRAGSVVSPHRVHRDANHAQASSTSTRFLPRVVAAGIADPVRQLGRAAPRTGLGAHAGAGVVPPPQALLHLRGSALRNCHDILRLVRRECDRRTAPRSNRPRTWGRVRRNRPGRAADGRGRPARAPHAPPRPRPPRRPARAAGRSRDRRLLRDRR